MNTANKDTARVPQRGRSAPAPKAPDETKDAPAEAKDPQQAAGGTATATDTLAAAALKEEGVKAPVEEPPAPVVAAEPQRAPVARRGAPEEPKPQPIPVKVFEDAATMIAAGQRTLQFSIAGISRHYHQPEDDVRTELQDRLAKLNRVEVPAGKVLVVVPKAFQLRGDDHSVQKFAVGTYPVPAAVAEHPYAKANGVKKVEQ